jgi:hypothetical protein
MRLLALRPLLTYCAASDDNEDDCGEQMECRLAGETEVPSATFVHHKIPHA